MVAKSAYHVIFTYHVYPIPPYIFWSQFFLSELCPFCLFVWRLKDLPEYDLGTYVDLRQKPRNIFIAQELFYFVQTVTWYFSTFDHRMK